MSNFEIQLKEQERVVERNKTRREKLAGYFFDLSKLIFAGLVVGSVTPLFSDEGKGVNWITLVMGMLTTYVLAFSANRILK